MDLIYNPFSDILIKYGLKTPLRNADAELFIVIDAYYSLISNMILSYNLYMFISSKITTRCKFIVQSYYSKTQISKFSLHLLQIQ